jgi:hypothetical protein
MWNIGGESLWKVGSYRHSEIITVLGLSLLKEMGRMGGWMKLDLNCVQCWCLVLCDYFPMFCLLKLVFSFPAPRE